jgi:hypothetical protein
MQKAGVIIATGGVIAVVPLQLTLKHMKAEFSGLFEVLRQRFQLIVFDEQFIQDIQVQSLDF